MQRVTEAFGAVPYMLPVSGGRDAVTAETQAAGEGPPGAHLPGQVHRLQIVPDAVHLQTPGGIPK